MKPYGVFLLYVLLGAAFFAGSAAYMIHKYVEAVWPR